LVEHKGLELFFWDQDSILVILHRDLSIIYLTIHHVVRKLQGPKSSKMSESLIESTPFKVETNFFL